MTETTPLFSVIIVNYNAGPYLRDCLQALSKQVCQDFETIVVDNGSEDNSLCLAKDAIPKAVIVEAGENLGFAVANNLAVERARGTWLVLLNPDAFAAPTWLAEIEAGIERHPEAAIFASLQLLDSAPDQLDGAGDPYHALGVAWRGDRLKPASPPPPEGEVFGPCGASAIYRRDAYLSVGGLEEKFFCYYEDVDLAFRLRLLGHKCVLLPRAVVRHVASAISGDGSDFIVYHVTRNRIWTFLRCMPWPLLCLLFIPVAATIAIRLLRAPLVGDFNLRWRAVHDAISEMNWIMTSRKRVQKTRSAKATKIAHALTWSLQALYDRRSDIKPDQGNTRAEP